MRDKAPFAPCNTPKDHEDIPSRLDFRADAHPHCSIHGLSVYCSVDKKPCQASHQQTYTVSTISATDPTRGFGFPSFL